MPMTAQAPQARIGARNVTRRFGAVVASDRVTFDARRGSIHALVGANGAGKTTLMRMLQGIDRPDEGTIVLDGQEVSLESPAAAFARGVGMVHQEFMLVPGLSLLENLVLSNEPLSRFGIIDRRAARRAGSALAAQTGAQLDWDLPVEDAPIHQLQILEILRLLYRGADVLILDEPTAVLAPAQVRDLAALMKRLRDEGRTILFISHKLDEVLDIADEITVLRAGRVVATLPRTALDARKLAELIVGSEATAPVAPRRARPAGAPVLVIDNLAVRDRRGVRRLAGVSLAIGAGEILGVAGVAGNGQDELVAALVGLRPIESGRMILRGADATRWPVARRRAAGLGYLSPDRAGEGLCLAAGVRENAVAGHHRRSEFYRAGLLRLGRLHAHARTLLDRFEVLRGSDSAPIRTLSGGNQQRVALARELDGDPKLLIAAQPTRGVDIRGTAFVHRQLMDFRERGGAVLLVSEELTELMALCDRIAVLHRGRLVGVLKRDEATIDTIGRLMLGTAA